MTFPFWTYARIPYRNGGRDRNGVDCWGLVKLVYQTEFGITLPSYDDEYTSAEDVRAVARTINLRCGSDWRKLAPLEPVLPGDAVLFAPDVAKLGTHIGIVVGRILGDLKFLHVRREGETTTLETLSNPVWRGFLLGIYRNLQLEERNQCAQPPQP